MLLSGAIGGAGAVLAEATILAVPPAVPTILGGSLIAATIGSAAGIAVAALAPLAALALPHEPDLMSELVHGRSAVTVAARGRVQRERARGMLRQHGATRILDMDGREDEVTFATPFATVMPRLRVHCEERFGLGRWDVYMPAYLFGWDRANRPDLDESLWEEAVPGLRAEWSRRHPERPWAEVEEAVLAAWEKAHSLVSPN